MNPALKSPSTHKRQTSSATRSVASRRDEKAHDDDADDADDVDFGDDFDEFEAGDEDADFGDFDDGFQQAGAPAAAQLVADQRRVSIPSFVCLVPSLGSLIRYTDVYVLKANIRS